MIEESTVQRGVKVIVDHVFRPYCSGFNMLKSVTDAFDNVEIRRYDVTNVDHRKLAELPSHVEAAIKNGEPKGFGAVFYVNGRLVRSNIQSLEKAIELAGGSRLDDASVWHPPLPQIARTSPGLDIRRITEDDIKGCGEPLPAFWCDLNSADPLVRQFLLKATQKQGCCMAGAYINGAASGFVTFFSAEQQEIPEAQRVSDGTLRIACLHVFPHRRRQGVATALLTEVIKYAREHGYRRVIANTGFADINEAFKGTPAGARSVYLKLGFETISYVEPRGPGDEGEAVMELSLTDSAA